MKKSEIFDVVITKVAEVCEVSVERIISPSRVQSVVEARVLLVQYLRRIGLSNDNIAEILMRRKAGDPTMEISDNELKQKAKTIDSIFNSYSMRCLQSYSFCLMSQELAKFCRDEYGERHEIWMKKIPSK